MRCPICFNEDFKQVIVLKPRLVQEWELAPHEVDYINRQQGFLCTKCNSNLRSMTLAESIKRHYSFKGPFINLPNTNLGYKHNLLEINAAGGLHNILKGFRKYRFAQYPTVDIQKLPFQENTFDLIIHSDTLEHVEDSIKGLKECFRVLKNGGALFYTVPIVYERLTRKRNGLSNSYHGIQDENQGEDYKVFTEYGADFWVEIVKAGFQNIKLTTLGELDSVAISAIKGTANTKASKVSLLEKIYFKVLDRLLN